MVIPSFFFNHLFGHKMKCDVIIQHTILFKTVVDAAHCR